MKEWKFINLLVTMTFHLHFGSSYFGIGHRQKYALPMKNDKFVGRDLKHI